MTVSIIWHGHATFSLDVDGTKIVVDPFFAGNNPAAKTAVERVSANYILQTHGHGDHIADTIALAKRTHAQVICNFEIMSWLTQKGYDNCHAMNIGGAYNFPFGRVKMTNALHSSSLPDGTYGGNPGGFLLTAGDMRIYFAGDTALFTDMGVIGAEGIDVAVLPIGDNFTMGPDDSLLALEYLTPKVVIPGHYNTWPVIAVDADDWANRVRAKKSAQPIVPKVDEAFTL